MGFFLTILLSPWFTHILGVHGIQLGEKCLHGIGKEGENTDLTFFSLVLIPNGRTIPPHTVWLSEKTLPPPGPLLSPAQGSPPTSCLAPGGWHTRSSLTLAELQNSCMKSPLSCASTPSCLQNGVPATWRQQRVWQDPHGLPSSSFLCLSGNRWGRYFGQLGLSNKTTIDWVAYKQQRFISQSPGSPRWGCWHVQILMRALFHVAGCVLVTVSSQGAEQKVNASSLVTQGHLSSHGGSTLTTSSNPNHLLIPSHGGGG